MRPLSLPLAMLSLAVLPLVAHAQSTAPAAPEPAPATAADSAGIERAARDYIEGWYTADTVRMSRALHPELAKRIVMPGPGGASRLGQMGAAALVRGTGAGGGSDIPAADRVVDLRILDIYGDMATVRLRSTQLMDYLHLARWNGEWKIVNVLWDFQPAHRPKPR